MAAVTVLSSSKSAYGFETPAGPNELATFATAGASVLCCKFACSFTGTYVQATGFTISWANDLIPALKAARRDGGTYTIWDVAAAAGGLEGTTTPAVVIAGPCTSTLAGTTTTGLLYGPDGATEHAAAAMLLFSQPLVFLVTFLDAPAA